MSCFLHLQSEAVRLLILCREIQVLGESQWTYCVDHGYQVKYQPEVILTVVLKQKDKVRKQSKTHSQSDGKRLWKGLRQSSSRLNIMVIKA